MSSKTSDAIDVIARPRAPYLFICLEGVDCVGKTTVAQALAAELGAAYYKSPGGDYAERRFEVDRSYAPRERYLFYRDAVRYDSATIMELLKESSVVCDRYIYSTFAVHAALDPSLQTLFESTNVLLPDHVFLLVADEDVRIARLQARPFHSGSDDDLALQRSAERYFREQGHTIIDTSALTVEQTKKGILRLLVARGVHDPQR